MNKTLSYCLLSVIVLFSVYINFQINDKFRAPSSLDRQGVFIGSFDPFTKGHLSVLLASIDQLNLTKLHLQVNSASNKDYAASVDERIEMIKASLKKYNLNIDIIIEKEPEIGKRAFVQKLHQETGSDIYQIMGSDVVNKSDKLFGDLAYVKRYAVRRLEDYSSDEIGFGDKGLASTVKYLNVEASSISSSMVKDYYKRAVLPQQYLDDDVISIIAKNGLYHYPDKALLEVKRKLFVSNADIFFDKFASQIPGLDMPSASEIENIQFSWSQSLEASYEHLQRMVLRKNPNINLEQKHALQAMIEKASRSKEFLSNKEIYQKRKTEIERPATLLLSNFDPPSQDEINAIEKALKTDDSKVIISINANYINSKHLVSKRVQILEAIINERFKDQKSRIILDSTQNTVSDQSYADLILRKYNLRASIQKLPSKKSDHSFSNDIKVEDILLSTKEIEQLNIQVSKKEEDLRVMYSNLSVEGFDISSLHKVLDRPTESTPQYVKQWEAANTRYQKNLDEYYSLKFDYQVHSFMKKFFKESSDLPKALSVKETEQLRLLKNKVSFHFIKYFETKRGYGDKGDVFRVDNVQGFFKTIREYYSTIEHSPRVSLNKYLLKKYRNAASKLSNFMMTIRTSPQMAKFLYTYFINKSKNPRDAITSINALYNKKRKIMGLEVDVDKKLKGLSSDPDVVTVYTPNHVQGETDAMIMSTLDNDDSLLFAAYSRMKTRQKVFDQVPNSNLIIVGKDGVSPIEETIKRLENSSANEIYIYPEGHFAAITSETRPVRVGFSAALLKSLESRGIKYQVVPLTYTKSAGVIESSAGRDIGKVSVEVGAVFDPKKTAYLAKNVKSRKLFNIVTRANWITTHGIDNDMIHGSPSIDHLNKILGEYVKSNHKSCHSMLRSLLKVNIN